DDADPFQFLMGKLMVKPELTPSQRAMQAERIATYAHGGNHQEQVARVRLDEAADRLKVAKRLVSYARQLDRSGDEPLIAFVWNGEMTIHTALTLLKHDYTNDPSLWLYFSGDVLDPGKLNGLAADYRDKERLGDHVKPKPKIDQLTRWAQLACFEPEKFA